MQHMYCCLRRSCEKQSTEIMSFVRHIELQNFLIAPGIYRNVQTAASRGFPATVRLSCCVERRSRIAVVYLLHR